MTNIPQGNNDVQALRRMKIVDFSVYRRGVEVFKLESRRQGHIRKVTQATYKEAVMTDDSIEVTLVSTERKDFKMRDYILYYDRPYFLNRLPEVSIDGSKRFTYKLTFEGTMYELGRVAFVLDNAHGYDFYGTLPEFGRLVVDNMNRVNMWVAWTYRGQSYKAKFKKTTEISHGGVTKLVYMWGLGFNHELEGMGERFIYTDGIPSVGDHGLDPEDFSSVNTITITAIRKWTLDFPKQKQTHTTYPQPEVHIPDNEYTYAWCSSTDAVKDDYLSVIDSYEVAGTWEQTNGTGSYEWGVDCELVPNSIVEGTIPAAVGAPSSPTDTYSVQQPITFELQYTAWHEDLQQGGGVVEDSDWTETVTIQRNVTYTAVLNSQTTWQIDPITPQSGNDTPYDYPTESKLMAYDNHSCLAVLQDLAMQWMEWEWHISDDIQYGFVNGEMLVCGTIVMRQRKAVGDYSGSVVHVLGFGKSGGLSSIKRKYEDSGNVPSRVYFYGGTQNLPQYYRNTRLCLPNYTKEKSYIEFAEISPCPFLLALENQTCEEIVTFDDIYPANTPFIIGSQEAGWVISMAYQEVTRLDGTTGRHHYLQLQIPKEEFFVITAKWAEYNFASGTIADWPDYAEWLTLKQYADTADHRDRYTDYYVGKSKYMNGKDTPYVVFQTGDLAGYQLAIHDCYLVGKEGEQKYIILQLNTVKEDNEDTVVGDNNTPESYYVPNSDVICHYGDKFIVTGINMPVAYTYYNGGDESGDFSAENALWKAAMDYMNTKVENIGYEVEVTREYVVKHPSLFRCNEGVQFNDITTDNSVVRRRIASLELDLVDGFKYKLSLSNSGIIKPLHLLGQIISQHTNG